MLLRIVLFVFVIWFQEHLPEKSIPAMNKINWFLICKCNEWNSLWLVLKKKGCRFVFIFVIDVFVFIHLSNVFILLCGILKMQRMNRCQKPCLSPHQNILNHTNIDKIPCLVCWFFDSKIFNYIRPIIIIDPLALWHRREVLKQMYNKHTTNDV